MSLHWPQVLAWRLRRHLLDPVGNETVEAVVRRLGAVPATPEAGAELAVGARRVGSRTGEVAEALGDGRIFKTFAFRGATHLLTPEDGGTYLALRTSSRMWERSSWQSHYRLSASEWPAFRECVREALVDGPLKQRELASAVAATRRFRYLEELLSDPSCTLLKPLAWHGDLRFAPSRDGRATFQGFDGLHGWAGLPDIDEAGRSAIAQYIRTYGPATPDHLHYWLGQGLGVRRKAIEGWLANLGDRLVEVEVEGESRLVHVDDLENLRAETATDAVRLLPAYDQWVLGPGTADPHVVPPAHRAVISRGANIVVVGGVVTGTWSIKGGETTLSLFEGASAPSPELLQIELARVGEHLTG